MPKVTNLCRGGRDWVDDGVRRDWLVTRINDILANLMEAERRAGSGR